MTTTRKAATSGEAAQDADFPLLCETCLGPNPYVRMLKDAYGTACKVCERPFTCFRWRPGGVGTRPKKTEVCVTCARAKNVCQTCLFDLQHNLPVQVRDAALGGTGRGGAGEGVLSVVPKSDGVREYTAAAVERAVAAGVTDALYGVGECGSGGNVVSDIALRLRRPQPKYERNRARVCSFFLRGNCTRGLYCPYRHERPEDEKAKRGVAGGGKMNGGEEADEDDEALKKQNLRDRYYGINDPVAERMLAKAGYTPDGQRLPSAGQKRRHSSFSNGVPRRDGNREQDGLRRRGGSSLPAPPADKSVKTLFVGGFGEGVGEEDVRALFEGVEGVVEIRVPRGKSFAFVEFRTRELAESGMREKYGLRQGGGAGGLGGDGGRVFVKWGRSEERRARGRAHSGDGAHEGGGGGGGRGIQSDSATGVVGELAAEASVEAVVSGERNDARQNSDNIANGVAGVQSVAESDGEDVRAMKRARVKWEGGGGDNDDEGPSGEASGPTSMGGANGLATVS